MSFFMQLFFVQCPLSVMMPQATKGDPKPSGAAMPTTESEESGEYDGLQKQTQPDDALVPWAVYLCSPKTMEDPPRWYLWGVQGEETHLYSIMMQCKLPELFYYKLPPNTWEVSTMLVMQDDGWNTTVFSAVASTVCYALCHFRSEC